MAQSALDEVVHQHETIRIETQMVGGHWVTSVLAAIATGIISGVDLKFCAEAIRTVEPVFGRYSVHRRSDDAAYVLDTNKAPLWTIAPGLAFVTNSQSGAAYAKQYCAKCHAIADEDASPAHAAPRFADVANTSGMTATALPVWLQSSHPTMPNILEPIDMCNVIAYILSLKN